MNAGEVAKGLRIGCVQYLNSRPLIYGIPGVILKHPSELARDLREGHLDVGLVPVFELLKGGENYVALNGVGVASEGPVYSVFVAHRGPIGDVERLIADPASLTSRHLVQVLCEPVLGRKVPLVDEPHAGAGGEARLLIGNQAIEFRRQASADWSFWDLGQVWTEWTGLPFVYAVWVMRRDSGISEPEKVAEFFREVASRGIANLEEIVAGESDVDFARRYLSEHIRFGFGEREQAGLVRFRRELEGCGFLSPGPDPVVIG